jgi:hypothetical protein
MLLVLSIALRGMQRGLLRWGGAGAWRGRDGGLCVGRGGGAVMGEGGARGGEGRVRGGCGRGRGSGLMGDCGRSFWEGVASRLHGWCFGLVLVLARRSALVVREDGTDMFAES